MAEEENRAVESGSNFSAVRELLRQAESLLTGADHNIPSTVSIASGGRERAPARPAVIASEGRDASSSSRASRALENFRNLFTSSSASTSFAPPPPKQQKRPAMFFSPKETWTHEFICIADKHGNQIPSRIEKFDLQDIGLGRKRITFNRSDNNARFCEKVQESYPKLAAAGGFEVMRRGRSAKELVVITPPARGYDVRLLRDEAGVGQAILYIRPLQRSIIMREGEQEEVGQEVLQFFSKIV